MLPPNRIVPQGRFSEHNTTTSVPYKPRIFLPKPVNQQKAADKTKVPLTTESTPPRPSQNRKNALDEKNNTKRSEQSVIGNLEKELISKVVAMNIKQNDVSNVSLDYYFTISAKIIIYTVEKESVPGNRANLKRKNA